MSIDQVQRYDAQAKRDGNESRRMLLAALDEAIDALPTLYLDTTFIAGPSFDLPATPNPKSA